MKQSFLALLFLLAAALMMGAMPVIANAAPEQMEKDKPAVVNPQAGQAPAKALEGKVNINKAPASELEKLPGIGAKTAELIIAEREKSGGFKSTDDLKNVKGIGDKKFEKIKDKITIE
ncbi:MAG: ComEA family DNA-binding protein [Syntrophobacteraceae bacterium]